MSTWPQLSISGTDPCPPSPFLQSPRSSAARWGGQRQEQGQAEAGQDMESLGDSEAGIQTGQNWSVICRGQTSGDFHQ